MVGDSYIAAKATKGKGFSLTILVTGGAGYVGSHLCLTLLEADYEIVVVDNLSSASKVSLERVQSLTGKEIPFFQIDVCDLDDLLLVFDMFDIDGVMHLAGPKSVVESLENPGKYTHNIIDGSASLIKAMLRNQVGKMVFSSSATVYADTASAPFDETSLIGPKSPYGASKLIVEMYLQQTVERYSLFRAASLRYFNPAGAHPSGLIGESPKGPPTNLMPILARVASNNSEQLSIFGGDYATPDGTGLRDYVHVMDVVNGHLAALRYLDSHSGNSIFNLGTGRPCSVMDLIKAYELVSGRSIPFVVEDRRPGDMAVSYANVDKAARELHWVPEFDIEDMCLHSWNFHQRNPQGYGGK